MAGIMPSVQFDQMICRGNEGVGILLNGEAAAWRRAGEVWSPVSSRIVTARLKWPDGGSSRRKAKDIYMTVVCVYAPTAKAPPGVKAKFFEGSARHVRQGSDSRQTCSTRGF